MYSLVASGLSSSLLRQACLNPTHTRTRNGGPEHSGVAPVGAGEATGGIVAGVSARVTAANRLTVGPASFPDN